MPSQKPPESQLESRRDSISERASDWIRRFIEQFEISFVDTSHSLRADANISDYQDATVRAMIQTLLESGMNTESLVETIGRVLIEGRPGSVQWNSKLNQRRFVLIDKEIQESLTPVERIELAGLTKIMREQVESEASLPMEGARALHRKLLELEAKD